MPCSWKTNPSTLRFSTHVREPLESGRSAMFNHQKRVSENMILQYITAGSIIFFAAIALNRRIRSTTKFYAKYIGFILYLSTISVIGLPLVLRKPNDCRSMWVYASLMDPISRIVGIKWEIRNAQNLIQVKESAIFVANHQSMYDIVGMLHLWRKNSIRCVTIAKNALYWLWPVGLAMWLGGTFFIKRSGAVKTMESFNAAAGTIFKNTNKLWIYVEGTRNPHPEKLLPFKKGAFRLAIEHHVPIIPVVYSPYYFINWQQKTFDSGYVIMDVLEPISTTNLKMKDLDDLIKKTYEIMTAKNEEFREIQRRI